MNRFLLAALLAPMAGAMAQGVDTSAPAADPAPSGRGTMGAYAPASLDNPRVQEARACIQKNLASITLNEVTEAYTQVVSGLNVKLVCSVQGEDGPAKWQFVAYQSLDGRWHFHSATCIQQL